MQFHGCERKASPDVQGIAQPAGDKAAFLDLLNQAVAVTDAPASPLALSNEVMRRRARWLIESADDLF